MKSCIICKTDKLRAKQEPRRWHVRAGININRVTQNKNLTYFAVGFSVISLTISELIRESHLDSMQQTELRLKCFIITGGRSKVPIVSPNKQLTSCHATRVNSKHAEAGHNGWKNEIIRLQKSENNSLPWNLRNSNIFFRCEKWKCSISLWNTPFACFPGLLNLHKYWTLCSIFYASKRNMSASQDAMTHSGYISDTFLCLACISLAY